MTVITGKIGSGKTVAMLKHCYRNHLAILANSQQEQVGYIDMAKQLGLNVTVYSYDGKEPIQEPVFVADMPGFLGKALRGFDINGMICDGEDVIVTKRIDNEFYQTDILTL